MSAPTYGESGRLVVRLRFSILLRYEVLDQPADFIFAIHALPTAAQHLCSESLQLSQSVPMRIEADPHFFHRLLRLRAVPGPLTVAYDAEVDIRHHLVAPESIRETPIDELPAAVLPFIYPSRYCESDEVQALAIQEFGGLPPGYARVEAIRRWVLERTSFTSGVSDFHTSAVDTLTQRAGVCRDFAHLMIALCRALNIPARFTSGIDYGADPALGPTDFHAYVEAYLDGRWYIFDPSGTAMPMGFVRLGSGRDAADVAFATIFGKISSDAPLISIEAVEDYEQGIMMPWHCPEAVSTDAPATGARAGFL